MKKDAAYYEEFQKKYVKGKEFLTILESLDAVNTRTISLLMADIKSWKLIDINKETMEEFLKRLQIEPKVLAQR